MIKIDIEYTLGFRFEFEALNPQRDRLSLMIRKMDLMSALHCEAYADRSWLHRLLLMSVTQRTIRVTCKRMDLRGEACLCRLEWSHTNISFTLSPGFFTLVRNRLCIATINCNKNRHLGL